VLLVPVVLAVWVLECSVPVKSEPLVGWMWEGHGFPVIFMEYSQASGRRYFLPGAFIGDLALALTASYIVALGVDLLVVRRLRVLRLKMHRLVSGKLRWTLLHPGFPAALLIPAVLITWVLRYWVPTGFEVGFPLTFRRWDYWAMTWGPLEVPEFVFDLVFALAVGYVVALAANLLLLRPIRRAQTKKRGPGKT
jgi:hypothetical protein